MIKLDALHVFRVFNGPSGVQAVMDKHLPDHGYRYATIQMWKQRGRISRDAVTAVLYCVEREGHHCIEFMFDDAELG